MELTNNKFNTMPEQVQQNADNIQTLAKYYKEIYNAKTEIDPTVVLIDENVIVNFPDGVTTGFLVDTIGNVFNIVNVINSNVYIRFMTALRGIAGPKGDKGDAGVSFKISGYVNEASELPTNLTVNDIGTAYFVGEDAPRHVYIWGYNEQNQLLWSDQGSLEGAPGETGPVGPVGPVGPYYAPSVDNAGNLSWTNDGGLINPPTINIKGPQGQDGFIAPGDEYNMSLPNVVTADTTDGIILHGMQLQSTDPNNAAQTADVNLTLPIVAGNGIHIDADETNEKVIISSGVEFSYADGTLNININ